MYSPRNQEEETKLRAEVRKQFVKKFPKLLKNIDLEHFALDICIGWVKVVEKVFTKLSEFDVEVVQVKQKFSHLKIFLSKESVDKFTLDERCHLYDLIRLAEIEADFYCEWCGGWNPVIFDNGYISRSCLECKQAIIENTNKAIEEHKKSIKVVTTKTITLA